MASSGSTNALFRLGEELLVRLPRQPGGSTSISKEATWLPVLAPLLPVSVPDVVAVFEPGRDYPERWSVVRWIEGRVATSRVWCSMGCCWGSPITTAKRPSGSPERAPGGVIKRAVELLEERPTEPWTTVGLDTELHLSARALQAGFKREVGMAPMAYLRMVRLRRAYTALREANAAETTVQAVALSLGLLHQGRFAANYRALFGETPSETLRR